MDLEGSGARMSNARWHPENPCATLSQRIGFQILEAWVWSPCAWMPGCWQDWNGLEEVTEVTAFWGEGIGRNSHTLELQELGGFVQGLEDVLSG